MKHTTPVCYVFYYNNTLQTHLYLLKEVTGMASYMFPKG